MSPAAVVGQQLTVSVSRGQNTPPAVDHREHHQHHYTWTRHEQQFRRQAVSQWGAPEIAIDVKKRSNKNLKNVKKRDKNIKNACERNKNVTSS